MIRRFHTQATQVSVDAGIFAIAFSLAYLIRFDGAPPASYLTQLVLVLPYVLLGSSLIYVVGGVHRFIWRYMSFRELLVIAACQGVVLVAMTLAKYLLGPLYRLANVPLSIVVLNACLSYLGTAGIRVLWRTVYDRYEFMGRRPKGGMKRVLLIGAGSAGALVAGELGRRPDMGLQVQGFIDDDPYKAGKAIGGLNVVGTTPQLQRVVERLNIDEVIITVATARRTDMRRILDLCGRIPVPVKIMPGLFEVLSGRVEVGRFREVRIEDLLGREVVAFEHHTPEILARFAGKRILVTGAGGSIGAELCRQLLLLGPSALLMLDKDENGLFEIDVELRQQASTVPVIPLVGDVRSGTRLQQIFHGQRPDVVFHAAAHKHVPLMEVNPSEAILNNVMGTRQLVELVHQYQVETFVLVSTDKAINPVNVMGASKRLAEMLVQAKAAVSPTRYSCVRFGNVLGSRGSVVPLFQKQIAAGGPVTVTHPEVMRYFMTIPEAAHLVIQAGSLGAQGEIFVLDMGEPVKILDLATDMIRLSGLRLGEDIDIVFIGLRPGEKLAEELLSSVEGTQVTRYHKIFIAPPTAVDGTLLAAMLARLEVAAVQDDAAALYQTLGEWFKSALARSDLPV